MDQYVCEDCEFYSEELAPAQAHSRLFTDHVVRAFFRLNEGGEPYSIVELEA